MSKAKKIWLGIGLSLLILLSIAYIVLYLVFPTQTPYYTNVVIDFICNKPLPVIGVSLLVVFFFVFKIVKIILANKGKKYSELLRQIGDLREKLEQAKQETEHYKEIAYNLYEDTKENFKEICDAIPNKKVKAIGEKIYGKETNSNTETKEL